MKTYKPSFKEKCLNKSPELICEEENKEFVIIKVSRTGKFTVGRGKNPSGAWASAAAFYNIK